jgi:hypothetical protein
MFRILLALLLLICSLQNPCRAQKDTLHKLHPPLNIPLLLSANFGELRPHHFHMGVDFKTNGKEGLSLFSVDSGYVARVKISPNGYGKVLYINHPGGITSVYAHCSKFPSFIDSVIRKSQQALESTEVDVFFPPDELRVSRGQLVAYSGNTGHSFGPHLHFEIRETATDVALNPLLYGFEVADHRPPAIKRVKAYALTKEGYRIPGKAQIAPITLVNNQRRIAKDTLAIPAHFCSTDGGIGLAFEATDTYDGAANVCGLYASQLEINGERVFEQRIDRVSFQHTRYINGHKDYAEYTNHKGEFHKAFRTHHNPLEIYPGNHNGIIKVQPGQSMPVHYNANDLNGNNSALQFTLLALPGTVSNTTNLFPASSYFFPDSSYYFENDYVVFKADRNTFYEPTPRNLSTSGTFRFGDPNVPIDKAIQVKFKLPEGKVNQGKYYIAVVTEKGKRKALKSRVEGSMVVAESAFLGTFSLKRDTIAPTLAPSNFKVTEKVGLKPRISWTLKETETDIGDYDAWVDGKWVPIEHEPKADLLILSTTGMLPGIHEVVVSASDQVGNRREWKYKLNF